MVFAKATRTKIQRASEGRGRRRAAVVVDARWLESQPQIRDETLNLLVSLGADVNARNFADETLIFVYVQLGPSPSVLRLLAHGASVDVRDSMGHTPLMRACSYIPGNDDGEVVAEVLRRSSIETRRAAGGLYGSSAPDHLAARFLYSSQPWHAPVLAEMLRSGVPFRPEHAPTLRPIAATLMQQQELDLEIFSSGRLLWDWRGHEAMVHLALQMQETRFYERRVAERQAEVRRLEAELQAQRGQGGGGARGG